MSSDRRSSHLKQLKLKAVIKESHCTPVQHLDTNLCDADCRNLFATVAKDQVTIYDDMHMGDHVAIVGNLALSTSPDDAKDVFHACAWVSAAGLSGHPYGDALLAVGGKGTAVHIISVVEAAVVGLLPVPAGTSVADLSGAAGCPGLLLVVCRDGSMQLWQISTGVCLWSCTSDAFTAALHPEGRCVLSANASGKLKQWKLQGQEGWATADQATADVDARAVVGQSWAPLQPINGGVDSLAFLTGDTVAAKTCDGHMAVYSWPAGKTISSWKVPGCGTSSTPSYSKRCSFGHTRDGRYVAVGNQLATAFVYDSMTGVQVAKVEAIRVQGPVRACGLSEDCRHLLMVAGHGYVFRFEAQTPAGCSDDEEPGTDSDVNMQDACQVDTTTQHCQQQVVPQEDAQQQSCSVQLQQGTSQQDAAGGPQDVQQQQHEAGRAGTSPAVPTASSESPALLSGPNAAQHTPHHNAAALYGSHEEDGVMLPAPSTDRQQVSRQPAADSPLVFRPTPHR